MHVADTFPSPRPESFYTRCSFARKPEFSLGTWPAFEERAATPQGVVVSNDLESIRVA